MRFSPEAAARAREIRFLLLDVDGVLTGGEIVYLPGQDGDEVKVFNSKDGVGVRLLQAAGLGVGLLTGRRSAAVRRRAAELGIADADVLQGASPKLPVFQDWLRRGGRRPGEICYVGDDIVDVPVMRAVGLPVAVADAHEEAQRAALAVTGRAGGRAAVREVADALIRAQGRWDEVVSPFLAAPPAGG